MNCSRRGRGRRGEQTFIGLGNLVILDVGCFLWDADFHGNVLLGVDADVRVGVEVHGEGVFSWLWGCLELEFEGDDARFGDGVEGGEGGWGDDDLFLLCVAEEELPLGEVVLGEVWSMGIWDCGWTGVLLVSAADEGFDVVFGLVFFEEVGGFDGCWLFSWRDDAGLDDELDEGVGENDLFAGDFEEGLFDVEGWELLGEGNGLVVLLGGENLAGYEELAASVIWDGHKLLDGVVVSSAIRFGSLDGLWGKVGELHQWGVSWSNGLDEVLVDVDGGESGDDIAISQSNSKEGLVQGNSCGTNLKFDYSLLAPTLHNKPFYEEHTSFELIVQINSVQVGPQQSKSLSSPSIQLAQILESPCTNNRFKLLFDCSQFTTSPERWVLNSFTHFLAQAKSLNKLVLFRLLSVILEKSSSRFGKNTILCELTSSIPPFSNSIRKNDTKEDTVNRKDVVGVSLRNNPLGESNSYRERLLSIWMTVLDKVVSDFLIGEGLVCLCDLDKALVQILNGFVSNGLDLVGMEHERDLLVVFLDCLFVGRL